MNAARWKWSPVYQLRWRAAEDKSNEADEKKQRSLMIHGLRSIKSTW